MDPRISYDKNDGTMRVSVRFYDGRPRNWVEYLKDKGLSIQQEAEGLLARFSKGVTTGTSYGFVVLTTDVAPSSQYSVTTGFLHQEASLKGGHLLKVESTLVLMDMCAEGLFRDKIPGVLVLMHESVSNREDWSRVRGRNYRFAVENEGCKPTLFVVNGEINVPWPRVGYEFAFEIP